MVEWFRKYSIISNMKKILAILVIFIFTATCVCFADENCNLRGYSEIELAKGTFIPVINTQEISTAYCDVGTKVKFISASDLYLYDTNIIPQNTEFFGYIEKLNEPIIGTNASMVIKVAKLRFSDGFEIPLKGYIYLNNNTLIGGELTEPTTYDQKVSYRDGFRTMIGYVPGPTRKPGEHKVIAAGTDLLILLTGPLYITHTVNN